nr:cytochrome c oxidase subunit II [Holostephanus sp. FJ-2023]
MIINTLTYFDLVSFILALCAFIPCWVFSVLGWQIFSYGNVIKLKSDSGFIEFCWTVFPALAVCLLCFLNIQFLAGDFLSIPGRIYKIVGRQWYWSYESGADSYYDSMMSDFVGGVDKPMRLIYGVPYKLAVTSSDVIHSFSLPDYHVKVDAIPGRINQTIFYPDRLGVFIGYCSELCGAGHAYMPIVLEIVRGKGGY